jgi:hypothetical protein
VFRDFDKSALIIGNTKVTDTTTILADLRGIYFPQTVGGDGEASDLHDFYIIAFEDHVSPSFFGKDIYRLDDEKIAWGRRGHSLEVSGVLKHRTLIEPPHIQIGYHSIQLTDGGANSADKMLRMAEGNIGSRIPEIAGLSGSPVFDLTSNGLCGMVVRGGVVSNKCTIHYLDIADMIPFFDGVVHNTPMTNYERLHRE